MQNRDDELEQFKQEIDLPELAASYGYSIDKKHTSKRNISMVNAAGGRIVASIATSGCWQYFSPDDDSNNGTVIDFVQSEESLNLGQVRKKLRGWLGNSVHPKVRERALEPQIEQKDPEAIRKYLKRFKPVTESPYLVSRGITKETINDPLFIGKILNGYKRAVIFPHFNELGICGYEIKSDNFTSFSEKGEKSVWYSKIPKTVESIVFCESGIEALSYHQLFLKNNVFFVSLSGNWSPAVALLIKIIINKYNCKVIAAFNHDSGGERQSNKLKILADEEKVLFEVHRPEVPGQDWNDELNN